ncbi:hypothetical protein VTO73DRAFT_2507 [Trametes versicolor]
MSATGAIRGELEELPVRSRAAPAPFDNPAANTILRSSGDTELPMDFRVHSVIMVEASEVFADMFAIPQPPRGSGGVDDSHDYVGDIPVVRLTEDAETLYSLLRLCYPIPDPELLEPCKIRPVLAAAMKYGMAEATMLLKNALRARTEDYPLGVWAAACSLGLEEETTGAALVLTRRQYSPTILSEAEGVVCVSAGQYFRLLKFIASGGQVDSTFSFWQANSGDAIQPTALPGALPLSDESALTLQERPFVDIICCASDGEELPSHKSILSAVSPLLQARIVELDTVSQHSCTNALATRNGLPVLDFDDASPVLSMLLELCYPVRRDLSTDLGLSLQHICTLTKAATKYDMGFVRGLLTSAFRARDYARTAEDALLWNGRAPAAYGWIPEMEAIAAPAYHELLAKHTTAHGRRAPEDRVL